MKRLALVLMIVVAAAGLLVGQKGQSEREKCLATCRDKCTKSYDTCVKDAKTGQARAACAKSKDLCNSVCVNKACQ